MRITLSAEIDKAIKSDFERLLGELRTLESMNASPRWLGPVAIFEAKQAEQTFATEGAASGQKWPDLLAGQGNFKSYQKWKRRNWPNRKLNVWRGDTRDSFRHVGNKDHIARARSGTLEFGSKAKLAAQMHEGQDYGGYRVFYLREKSPRIRKNRRTGKPTKGANWFTLFVKEVPERPLARKSAAQSRELKLSLARELLLTVAKGNGGAIGRGLGKFADRIRPNPKA